LKASSSSAIKQWRARRQTLPLASQARSLSVLDAIQVCYSYSHSGYSPQALLQPLTQLVLQQPELLMGLSLRRCVRVRRQDELLVAVCGCGRCAHTHTPLGCALLTGPASLLCCHSR
jgi:hypothetical protein